MSGRVAWFCTYTPLEILDAAGLLPCGVRDDSGKAHEDVLLGDAACSFVRSCLGAKSSGACADFDGVVIVHSCECMRRLYDAWMHDGEEDDGQWAYLLDLPKKHDLRSVGLFASNLRRMQDAVRERFRDFSSRELEEAIRRRDVLYRELGKVQEARKWDPPGIRGSRFAHLLRSVFTMPPEKALAVLEGAVGGPESEVGVAGAPRLMIYGGPLSARLLELVEDAGGEVVVEYACNGLRSLRGEVRPEGDPLRALAAAYLEKPPCPRMLGATARTAREELRALVSEYRLDGVIYCAMKFCANLQVQWPLLREGIFPGVPVKMVESDISGQVDPREIEAFVRRLRMRRGS